MNRLGTLGSRLWMLVAITLLATAVVACGGDDDEDEDDGDNGEAGRGEEILGPCRGQELAEEWMHGFVGTA